MRRVHDAVDDRVAEVDVGRRHVDLRAQAALAVLVLAVAHVVEAREVLLGRRVAPRARDAGLGRDAAVLLPLLLGEEADVGLAPLHEVLGDLEHRVEVVGRAVEVLSPVEAEPADVRLDVLGELVGLLAGVRVVEAQVALAAELLRHAEVDADRLGVADVEVAVGLRREAGDDLAAGAAGEDVALDPLFEEVLGLVGGIARRGVGVFVHAWGGRGVARLRGEFYTKPAVRFNPERAGVAAKAEPMVDSPP